MFARISFVLKPMWVVLAVSIAGTGCSQRVNSFDFLGGQKFGQGNNEATGPKNTRGTVVPIENGKTIPIAIPTQFHSPAKIELISGPGEVLPSGEYKADCGTTGCPAEALVRITDPVNGDTHEIPYAIYLPIRLPPLNPGEIVDGDPLRGGPAENGYGETTYSISPVCKINSKTGVISDCPEVSVPTTVEVKACDAINNCDTETFILQPRLKLVPAEKTVRTGDTFTPTVTGGVGKKTCKIVSGPGSINPDTCQFTTAGLGDTVIEASDTAKHTVRGKITTVDQLGIQVLPPVITVDNTAKVSGIGGITPYKYKLLSGPGSINETTGVYTASAVGRPIVAVVDAGGLTASQSIEVVAHYTISASPAKIAPGNTSAIQHSGGVPEFKCTVTGPGTLAGNVVTATGVGMIKVSCKDAVGNLAATTIESVTALKAMATPPRITPKNTSLVSATGGVGPYNFVKSNGPGSINASSGLYQPTEPGTATIKVCDSITNCELVTIEILPLLDFAPAEVAIEPGKTHQVPATGGVPTLVYSRVSGQGTIDPTTALFTAPNVAGTTVVQVKDSLGNTATRTYKIQLAEVFKVDPIEKTLTTGEKFTPTFTGNKGKITCKIISGGGKLDEQPVGTYVAPATPTTAAVQCEDESGAQVSTIYKVVTGLTLTPSTASVPALIGSQTYTASSGTAPYVYTLDSGYGTIDASTGVFTSKKLWVGDTSSAVIKVTDKANKTATATAELPPSIVQWGSKSDTSKENISGGSVADAQGNLYVVGSTTASDAGDPLGTGHGLQDCLISKLNSQGQLIWAKQIGGGAGRSTACFGSALLDPAGALHFTGGTNSPDIGTFVVGKHRDPQQTNDHSSGLYGKIDANGNLVFIKLMGAKDVLPDQRWEMHARQIARAKSGDIYVTGSVLNANQYRDIGTGTGGSVTPLIWRFGSNGQYKDAVQASYVGSQASELPSAIVIDDDNSWIYIVGYGTGCAPNSVTGYPCKKEWETKVTRIDLELTRTDWMVGMGGLEGGVSAAVLDDDHNLWIAGMHEQAVYPLTDGERSAHDLTVFKLSSGAKVLNHVTFGAGKNANQGAEYQWSFKAWALENGGVTLSGSTNGTLGKQYGTKGTSDVFIMQLDKNAKSIWRSQVGFKNASIIQRGMVLNPQGGYYVTGESNYDKPNLQHKTHQKIDHFLLKFSEAGVPQH